jgi:hypothetical protein
MPTEPARNVVLPTDDPRPGQKILSWRRLLLCLAAGSVGGVAVGVFVSASIHRRIGV